MKAVLCLKNIYGLTHFNKYHKEHEGKNKQDTQNFYYSWQATSVQGKMW